MKEIVGPGVDLQILTRSVSGVTLTTQSIEGLMATTAERYFFLED